MSGVAGTFPNSNETGVAIPFDLLFPTNLGKVNFTVASSAVIALPANAVLLTLRATADCIIRFDGNPAVIPASGAFENSSLYIQVDEVVNIVAPSANFTVIGETASGTLFVQVSQPWTSSKVNTNLHKG